MIGKTIFTLAASLALVSCGLGSGDDFTIDTAITPNIAQAELGQISGEMFAKSLHARPPYKIASDPGTVSYIIPAGADYDHGTLDITITGNDKGGSHIAVAIDLPPIRRGDMILNESKIETMLEVDMRKWAKAQAEGGNSSEIRTEIGYFVGTLAVALQRWEDFDDTEAMIANADMDMMFRDNDEYEDESEYTNNSGYGKASYDFEDDASGPMDDPDDSVEDYGTPMDDGMGDSADDWAS